MSLAIDHISYASSDLGRARTHFREAFGLDAVEGGSHPQWGTANLIVPLGEHFIEVVGIADPVVAAADPVGRTVARRAAAGDRPLGLCLRAVDLDAEADRLGTALLPGERRYADGRVLTWRQAGIAEALATPGLPYFFQYADDVLRLGATPPRHDREPVGIVRVYLAVDAGRFERWTGGADLPVEITPGTAGLTAVDIAMADGSTITVGATATA